MLHILSDVIVQVWGVLSDCDRYLSRAGVIQSSGSFGCIQWWCWHYRALAGWLRRLGEHDWKMRVAWVCRHFDWAIYDWLLHWMICGDVLSVEPSLISSFVQWCFPLVNIIKLAILSNILVRVDHVSFIDTIILGATSFKVSRCDSLNGSILSWGLCLVLRMNGHECVEA